MGNKSSGLVFLLAVACVVPAFVLVLPMQEVSAAPVWRFVGGAGGGNYSTIQSAVDAATSGDKIYVFNGTYNEQVSVGKALNITGQDWQGTIVDAGNSGNTFSLWAAGITLYNLKITRAGNDCIVIYNNADNCKVEHCRITLSAKWALDVQQNSDNCIIQGNIIDVNVWGIILMNGIQGNAIYNNRINNSAVGIYIYNGNKYNTIRNNIVTNISGNAIDFTSLNQYNRVWGNVLAKNYRHAWDDSANFWNLSYPTGGNFYDDYSGTDMKNGASQNLAGNDGLGDTSRTVPGGGTASDAYPLFPAWNALEFFAPQPSANEVVAYAMGSCKVAVVFPESNGVTDTQYENWSLSSRNTVISEITEAFTWWSGLNSNAALSFSVINLGTQATTYEPIRRPSTDEGLWIGEIMSGLGYTTGDYKDRVKAYNHWLRTTYGTDWAFTVFVVDSENPSEDGYFTDGKVAWCQLDKGLVIENYRNDNWGISSMNKVVAHETGHVFFATDEYITPGERGGYMNELEVDNSGFLMDNNNLALSSGTWNQVGWRDTDADNIPDILDVDPNTQLDSFTPDPTTDETPYYTGAAVVVPYANSNIYSSGRAITLNKISNVQYRVDNGSWSSASALDGMFNGPVERYYFRPSTLSTGKHYIETRAVLSNGNSDPTPAYDVIWVSSGVQTIYVNKIYTDNPANHRWNTITKGIADANSGDTVFVYNGTYFECVSISNSINLIGQDRGGTIIDGSGGPPPAIYISGGSTQVCNLTVRNSPADGIQLPSSYNTIINCDILSNAVYGVSVTGTAKHNRIWLNNFIANKPGGKQAFDATGKSFWNGTSLGNHWSTWVSPDASPPFGIVDNAYILDGTNNPADFFPLVGPVGSSPPVVPEPGWMFAMFIILSLSAISSVRNARCKKKAGLMF